MFSVSKSAVAGKIADKIKKINYLFNYMAGVTQYEWFTKNRNYPSDYRGDYPKNPLEGISVFAYPFLMLFMMLAAPAIIIRMWHRRF